MSSHDWQPGGLALSLEVDTEQGRLQRVIRYGAGWRAPVWYLRCPVCEHRAELDPDQLHGRVSVYHDGCSYHETFDFAAAVTAALSAKDAVA